MAVTESNQHRRVLWASTMILDAADFIAGVATVFVQGAQPNDDVIVTSDAGTGFSFTGKCTAPGVVEIYQGGGAGQPVVFHALLNLAADALWGAAVAPDAPSSGVVAVPGVLPGDAIDVLPSLPAGQPLLPQDATAIFRATCSVAVNIVFSIVNTAAAPLALVGITWSFLVLAFRGVGGSGPLPAPTTFGVYMLRPVNMAFGYTD